MKNIEQPKPDTRERITILSAKDLEISYFCGSGAGGQARNKVASGVQIRHEESGAIGRASDSRSQADNKKTAFIRLNKDPRMKFWIAKQLYAIRMGETLEQSVAEESKPEHLRFEIRNATGQWEEVTEEYFNGEAAAGR